MFFKLFFVVFSFKLKKKTCSANGELFYMEFCFSKSSFGGLQLVFHFGTENWEEPLKNTVYDKKHCQRHNGPEGWVHLAKVILQVQSQILIEIHLQNLDSASTRNLNQTSAYPLNLKFKILTQPSFRISTKIQHQNLYKTSEAKCWTSSSFKILLNFNFKILTNPCAQRELLTSIPNDRTRVR